MSEKDSEVPDFVAKWCEQHGWIDPYKISTHGINRYFAYRPNDVMATEISLEEILPGFSNRFREINPSGLREGGVEFRVRGPGHGRYTLEAFSRSGVSMESVRQSLEAFNRSALSFESIEPDPPEESQPSWSKAIKAYVERIRSVIFGIDPAREGADESVSNHHD